MSPRLIVLLVAVVLLVGCGPDQAKIKEDKERADRLKAELEESKRQTEEWTAKHANQNQAPKQWNKSNPRVAALLEKRRQLERNYPVPMTLGKSLEQAIRETKAKLNSSLSDSRRTEYQRYQERLDQMSKGLEANSLAYVTNALLHLENQQLKSQRAGIDPAIKEESKDTSQKRFFQNEEDKKDEVNLLRVSIEDLKRFKKQLEDIELQLAAASK